MEVANLIGSFDVGSNYIKTALANFSGGTLRLIGVGVSPTRGFKNGHIVNRTQFINSLEMAYNQAKPKGRTNYIPFFINLATDNIKIEKVSFPFKLGDKPREIHQKHLNEIERMLIRQSQSNKEHILNVIKHSWVVDDISEISDPVGLDARNITLEAIILSCSVKIIEEYKRCLEELKLKLSGFIPEPIALGKALLDQSEVEEGVAILDFGGPNTHISIFKNGNICDFTTLPLGADHITSDISICLKTSIQVAEELKRKYGNLPSSSEEAKKVVIVPCNNSPEKQNISLSFLGEIIQARVEEILNFAKEYLEKSGYLRKLKAGIVLTGGGIMVAGLKELAEEMLEMPARIGRIKLLGFEELEKSSSLYSVASGLLIAGLEKDQGTYKKSNGEQKLKRIYKGFKRLVDQLF